jgi:hypothetical protein
MLNVAESINTHYLYKEIEESENRPEKHQPISLVFTSINGARKSLEKTKRFLGLFKYGIEVLIVEAVPYALPLDEPQIPLNVSIMRLEEIAKELPSIIKISVYLCRDEVETLKRVLTMYQPVVMGVGSTWRSNHEKSLARKLHRAGYNMISMEAE